MATIHFSSGKTREIDSGKLDKFIMDLKGRGIKLMVQRSPDCTLIVPLNSNTMEFIEKKIEEVKPIEVLDGPELEEELETMKAELVDSMEEMEKKKDPEEKQKDQLKEIFDKSNCTHVVADQVIYKQETANKGTRYFPVCSKCGLKQRYVKAASLSEEEIENAMVWAD